MIKLTSILALTVLIVTNTVVAQTCTVNAGAIATGSLKTFCGGDGLADVVNVTITGASGDNYRVLYADANGVIRIIQQGNTYNFEGSPSTVLNAVGISYNNGLQGLAVGNKISNLVGCYALSTTGFTITVFNKEGGSISTNGSTTATVCVDDHIADVIPITYTGFDAFGAMWVSTDVNNNVLAVYFNVPNLEGTGAGIVRLRLITSCMETFSIPVGTNISQLPANMDFTNEIVVTKKIGCAVTVCAPQVKACPGKVLMCVKGVSTCVASNQVNKMLKSGAVMGGCIVCTVTSAKPISNRYSSNAGATIEKSERPASIYPNPGKGNFTINNAAAGRVKYELHSMTKLVWSKSVVQTGAPANISLEYLQLPAGVYYLRIASEKGVQVKPVVIRR
jgi:hypothetical protein